MEHLRNIYSGKFIYFVILYESIGWRDSDSETKPQQSSTSMYIVEYIKFYYGLCRKST